MRILLVHDYASPAGGAEISLVVLRDALLRRGHQVRILSTSAGLARGDSGSADYLCFGTTSRWRTLLQMYNPWAARSMRRALRDFRPDLVHVDTFLTQLSPSILPLLRQVPSLHYISWYRAMCPVGTKVLPDGTPCRERPGIACCRHGCLPLQDRIPMLIQTRLWRRNARRFVLHLVHSEEARRLAEAEGHGPIQVLWNGVPVIPPRPPLPADPLVLFAGRLVPQKGPELLLRAFARVADRFPSARLLIAGDGPERVHLAELADALHLRSRVSMTGHLDRASLEKLAAEAWVQVVPSRWSESFGDVAAEAMMRGTAVIASRLGAMAEYIRDGETGILVAPGDADQLSDALATLLADPALAERMGRRGREVALAQLTAERCAEKIEAAYRGLLAMRAAPPGGEPDNSLHCP